MDIKNFLQSSYKKENFIEFIFDKFYGFEENDADYEIPSDSEQDNIQKYKFLGQVELSDGKEFGFFELIANEDKNIENNRVSFNKILKDRVDDNFLDGAIAVFYNPSKPDIWRLSFIQFSYDENNKQQVTNLKRHTYVLGENIPIKTALSQLEDFKYPTINKLKDIFSVEKVSKEFFTKYKELYYKLVKDIIVVNTNNITTEEEDILKNNKTTSFYIKKLLGRIVFLYFVQKKGWLNNDKKFLSNLFKDYTQKNPDINFYDEILETLFFKGLNEDRGDKKLLLGDKEYSIPYLNGGLFESDYLDDKNLTIPNKDLEQVIELFDSYNFTVIEDTPHDSEIAIDPEMLGRVFEDLLEDRKDKGAFYTPREIVHYMCQQSIVNYLSNIFDDTEGIKELVLKQNTDNNKFVKDYGDDIYNTLLKIKVLDPAIGSGAYPMGMLHEIIQVLSNIDKRTNIGELKRKVIEDCIYGVDIEPSAVEIAKLRFWLSIVVDEKEPTPLPNLRYKIMVGNSLLETINGFDPFEKSELNKGNGARIVRMKDKFHSFYKAKTNDEKKDIRKDIEDDVDIIFAVALKNHQKELEKIISKNDLFTTNTKLRNEHLAQVQNEALIKKILNEYKDNKYTTELFLYKIYFAEVLENGGFNVVIGNPPYVRQEKIKELKSKKEIQDFESYCGTADLYIYFFEKGYKLLKPNGVLSYITSNKYTRAKYGKDFRKFVLDNTAIKEYIDFNGVKVFESATVDTSILTYQKLKEKDSNFIYCDINEKYKKGTELNKFIVNRGFDYSQNDLSEDSFNFASPQELRIKKQIEKIGKTLISQNWNIKINYGIKTGFNEAFIIDGKIKDELIEKDKKSAEIIKPILRGKDIKRYSYKFADKWLINLHNNPPLDIKEYPAIQEHLDTYYDKLEKRSDKGITPYNLRNCAYLDGFGNEKIIYPETVQGAYFYFDIESYYIDKTAFMIIGKDIKYIFAIISSKLVTYYYKNYCGGVILGEKGYQYNKHAVQKLPIPQIPKEQQKPFKILVDYILFAKEQDIKNEASLFESIIDGMVYDLYFEEDMKKADCFITSRVEEIVKPFGKYDNDNDKKMLITVIYDICKEDKTIQRCLIFSRNIEVVKVINGVKKDD